MTGIWGGGRKPLIFKAYFCSQNQSNFISLLIQVAAMLSILVRYNWQQFSVVTSEIAGHDDFVQAVRDKVAAMKTKQKFK
jgi:ionotropic glutamate receptor NMDA 2B